jgi:hypothetical protein
MLVPDQIYSVKMSKAWFIQRAMSEPNQFLN